MRGRAVITAGSSRDGGHGRNTRCVVWWCGVVCGVVLYGVVWCGGVWRRVVLCCVVPDRVVCCMRVLLHVYCMSSTLYCVVLCRAALHRVFRSLPVPPRFHPALFPFPVSDPFPSTFSFPSPSPIPLPSRAAGPGPSTKPTSGISGAVPVRGGGTRGGCLPHPHPLPSRPRSTTAGGHRPHWAGKSRLDRAARP